MLIYLRLNIILLLSVTIINFQTERVSALKVIREYFNDFTENRWVNIDKWYVKEEANKIYGFMNDKVNQDNKVGLLNIKKARLLNAKELPFDYAGKYIPNYYAEKYGNPKVFYVAVDYKVYHENEFHLNGVNYFLVVLVLENNNWKIALTPLVPINSIIFDGYGFGTKDEKTFDSRRLKFTD